jgi:cytoskeletal protein RodZ
MRRFGIFGIWLVVVVFATTVTWQIVSAADDQVNDRPVAPLNVAAPVLTDTTTSTTLPSSVTTTAGQTTPTSSQNTGTSSPTTSATAATTPTTSAPSNAQWQSRSVQTGGGTVIIRYRPGEVQYQSATPSPGFQVEVDDAGPPDVKVEFESETQKFEVEARWKDGSLDVKTSTSSED